MIAPVSPAVEIAKRLIIAAVALISTMLGAFFIWLGAEVNSIGKKVERLDSNVELLLSAREREIDRRSESNADRLDDIQGNRQ